MITQPLCQEQDAYTKSIFKQITPGFYVQMFSFSLIGCFNKTREYSLTYYLPIARKLSENANKFVQDLKSVRGFNFLPL